MKNNVIDIFSRQKITSEQIEVLVPMQLTQDRRFVIVDCETGGTDPFRHSILTIGMLAMVWSDADQCMIVEDELDLKISDNVYVVTEKAMEINGLDLEELKKDGVSAAYATTLIQQFITRNFGEGARPILVGHNVGMDKYFLWRMMAEFGVQFDSVFNHRMIDLMGLLWALYYTGNIPLEACSSSGAYDFFEIENENPHDALSDCFAQAELLDEIIYELGGWAGWATTTTN